MLRIRVKHKILMVDDTFSLLQQVAPLPGEIQTPYGRALLVRARKRSLYRRICDAIAQDTPEEGSTLVRRIDPDDPDLLLAIDNGFTFDPNVFPSGLGSGSFPSIQFFTVEVMEFNPYPNATNPTEDTGPVLICTPKGVTLHLLSVE